MSPRCLCKLEVAVATRALPGEHISGDLAVYKETDIGVLVGVVDGLGHGPDAAIAAREAVTHLEKAAGKSLHEIVGNCHEAIRHTRGVVVSLAWIDYRSMQMEWVGIGNVEGIYIPCGSGERSLSGSIPLRGGVVGARLPKLAVATQTLAPGDVIILATDGISPSFIDKPLLGGTVKQIADRLLAKHAKQNDDALVLVGRCEGLSG